MADDDDLLVTISGPALAMLLYENARVHDQIGFLLGEVLVYMTKQVTDSDRDVENVKQHINIKSIVAYPLGSPFFDSIGQIDENKLNFLLKDNAKKVVGWYHYRLDFRLAVSFRDGRMHNELTKYFSKVNKLLSSNNFIFCLLNSMSSDSGGTHKFKQCFMRANKLGTNLVPVSLKINNLGADTSKPDGSDYKPVPQLSSYESDVFNLIYENIRDELQKVSGVKAVSLIQTAAEELLEKLILEVNKSDKKVSELEKKLFKLRNDYYQEYYAREPLELKMSQMEVDDKSNSKTVNKSASSSEIISSLPKILTEKNKKPLLKKDLISDQESQSSDDMFEDLEEQGLTGCSPNSNPT